MDRKLLFIYQAQSGMINSITDWSRRTFQPATYECNLRKITYGSLGVKQQWKSFVKKLDIPSEFLRKNEFPQRYPKALYKTYPGELRYPCVLLWTKGAITPFLDTQELDSLHSVDELEDTLTQKLLALRK